MSNVLPRSSEPRAAANLAGKYRLIAELGQGGMATVYLAVAIGKSGFRKLAVVKLLRPEIAVDTEFVEMFLDEAKLCARLSHPNIVHTYDVGVDEVGHLMAMEYLDGVSLHAAIGKLGRNGGPMKFPMQARVLLDVVEGLRYAHELKDYDGRSLQIVHRDVTPHNIFVTYDGQVKLLDFGIAKAATSSVRTATGVIKGKLTYMAPEQARGDGVDARADLYAVGVMLWEAVTGKRRWPAGLSQPALFTRLASGEPPQSPQAASFGYPDEIDGIVLRALAVNPDDRYQTAAELSADLERVLRKLEPVSLRDLGAMLATAFDDGRQRLREIIEEQFRAIEAGERPSERHQLPAVSLPTLPTGSEVLAPPAPAAEGAKSDSASIRMTVLESTAPPPQRARSRGAIVLAAIAVGATAIGFAAVGSHGRPGVQTVPATPPPSVRDERTVVAAPIPPSAAATDAQAGTELPAIPSAAPAPPQTVRSTEAHASGPPATMPIAHGAPLRGAPLGPPSPAASALPPATTSAVLAPSASESGAGEGVPIRRPEGKPKVQLERDNPWP
jgi:eukaryotic-like serine/threonine-protein kinase